MYLFISLVFRRLLASAYFIPGKFRRCNRALLVKGSNFVGIKTVRTQNGTRMLAITEALLGQLYLVSAVALVVSRFGLERVSRRGDPNSGDGT